MGKNKTLSIVQYYRKLPKRYKRFLYPYANQTSKKMSIDIKKIVKKALFSLIYYSGLLHLYLVLMFKKRKHFPAVIINYHRFVKSTDGVIDNEPTVTHCIDDFKKEMCFIKRYFDLVSLDKIVETLKTGRKFKKPTVAVTIDDGYKDNFELLFPILKEFDIPVTIFLTTSLIGTNKGIWVDRLAEIILNTKQEVFNANGLFKEQKFTLTSLKQKRYAYRSILGKLKDLNISDRDRYLTQIEEQLGMQHNEKRVMLNWSEIRIMQQNNIHFGAHTCTHPILTNMPLEDAKKEIFESKRIIEEKLGLAVKHFAYPNGRPKDFNEELRQFCKEVGFESISTCDFGNNERTDDVWALRRIGSYVPISVFAVYFVRSFLYR